MSEFTIGEVAKAAGVRASTLRYYERTGVLPRARRSNGQRRYTEEMVDLVKVARFAQGVGFSLAEIRELFRQVEGRSSGIQLKWRYLARAKISQLDAAIAKAQQMKSALELGLQCGCIRIEDCLGRVSSVRRRSAGPSG